ncbi:MAG: hypothetical protein LBV79_07745, partial [Candidatus Adiutrix sp.]|nr:hypothetical protein [Candidatus Adiutrix sp.]
MPLVRYRPSGLYEPAALWAVPLLLAVGIAILSIPYALYDVAYMAKRPVDDHNIGTFVPMIWITFSLFYAMALIFLFKIRNFKVAVILTCIGAFVGYVLHWLVLYYFSDSGLGFFDFVCERVHSGIWVHYRHYGVYLEKGGFLVFAWVMEFMALMAAVGYLVPGEPVSILFSEKFNDWYKWINLRRDVYANFGQSLANLLQEG